MSAMGLWYASLPDQVEFLMEKRWTTDQHNIRRIVEDEVIPILYLHESGDERSYIKSGSAGLAVSSEPLRARELEVVLEKFDTALPEQADPAFISSLRENFVERDDRHTAALSTASFTLVRERFGYTPSPFAPPMVESQEAEEVTIVALSFFDPVQRWGIYIVAEVDGDLWVITEDLVERYIPKRYVG
jgi:hypothetical protein